MDPEIEAAKFVAEKALDALGNAFYNSDTCANLETQTPAVAYLCKLIGGATGASVEAWREDVTKRLEGIKTDLDTLTEKVNVVDQSVKELLTRAELLDLELGKVLHGVQAYQYLLDVQERTFNEYTDRCGQTTADDVNAWQPFYGNVVNKYDLPEHLDVVVTAITTPLLDTDPLLRTFVKEVLVKARAGQTSVNQMLAFYHAYEAYVGSVLIELKKGYSLYALALLYLEMRIAKGAAIPAPSITGEQWAVRRLNAVTQVAQAFLNNLVWLIVGLSRDAMGGTNPFFLHPAAREMMERALRFAVRATGAQYGLRGVVLSMGDQFTGALTANGTALPMIGKFRLVAEDEADWWTASRQDGVYDTFHLTNAWNVYYYALPAAAAASYQLSNSFPYPAAPVAVQQIDEIHGTASNAAQGTVNFGSFLEVERAGGGFALLSGAWHSNAPPWRRLNDSNASRTPGTTVDYTAARVTPIPLADGTRVIGTTSVLEATLCSAGEVYWSFGSLFIAAYSTRFQSDKAIRSAEAGRFEIQGSLHPLPTPWTQGGWFLWGPQWMYTGPEWSHWSHERMVADHDALNGLMVVRKLWYTPSTASYGCSLHPRVNVFLSADGGIVNTPLPADAAAAKWDLDADTSQNVKNDDSVSTPLTFSGVLGMDPATAYHVYVQPTLDVQVETSGMDQTPYFVYLAVQLTNLRIVRRVDRPPS